MHRFFSNQGDVFSVYIYIYIFFSNPTITKSYYNTWFSKAGINGNVYLCVFVHCVCVTLSLSLENQPW